MGLFNFFTQEIAIDLGTANTLIIHNNEVVVNEPSIVALDRNNIISVTDTAVIAARRSGSCAPSYAHGD